MKWTLGIVFLSVFFFSPPAFAQRQLKIGTDIPLLYGIAYKYSPDQGVGGGLKLGILTEPYNSVILSVMESFGTQKAIVDIVREGFKMGLVIDGSVSWHWSKNYVGANIIFMNLSAGEAPLEAIDEIYDLNILSYWDPISSVFSQSSMQINLNSNLMQLGVHYGRRLPLNERLELQLEFGINKNIGSTNIFTSDYPYPQSIYDAIDKDLVEAYRKYAIIPSLGVYLVYNL